MTTQGCINSETLSAFLEGLPDLLESLRAQGYGLGTRQHVAAHELIGSLFAHGGLPPTLLELDEWLAPLICFTPAQQEDFRDRYLQWLVERRLVADEDLPPDPPPVKIPEPRPTPPPPSFSERIVRWVSAHRLALFVSGATLIALALFAVYYFGTSNDPDPTQVVVLNTPLPDPTPVPLPLDDFEVPPPPLPKTTTPTPKATPTPDLGLAWDVDTPVSVTTKTADLSKFKLEDSTPPSTFWERNYTTLVALGLVPPFAALGLWHFLRRRRRRRDAERWRDERPRYDKIKVRGARERVFQSAALRPIARGLRHYLSVESHELDVRSTIRASIGRGGLFTPVYGQRRALPEYLVLIDRVGFGDQLAQFNSDIVARLNEQDVYLDTYYFHGDPRCCREGGADSPQLSLSDLAARHPDHYLLIFSDGTGLLSTTTGRPEPFIEQFLFWRGRALLTPIPRIEWEYREWALEREGLKVLPASLDGLRLLVEAVNTGARSVRAPDFDETPPYPDILREQPTLWKERDEPPPHQTRRLVTHLRRYLGPKGFELLCACAVYPVMQWGVTLFLAYELLGRTEVDAALPRLLRLPWFRNGTMPQWLRRVLIREMPGPRRRFVRERLEHLLLAFLEDPERGLRPRFAEEQDAQKAASATLLTRMSERLAAWRRSRRLRRRLEHAHVRSPLAEPVFLNYITNNRRAEALPAPVRNKLFQRGVAAFGLRLAPAAALVTLAVLTGLFLILYARPVEGISTHGAPEDLCAFLCPSPSANTTDPDFTYTPTTVKQGQTVNVSVRAVTSGEYDFDKMSLTPADSGGKITLKTIDTFRETYNSSHESRSLALAATLTVVPDAPLGKVNLNLVEGEKLRAALPINVAAAAPTPPPQCPAIRLNSTTTAPPVSGVVITANVNGARNSSITYSWNTKGVMVVVGGMNARVLQVVPASDSSRQQSATVTVGGLPGGCPNTATIDLTPRREALKMSVSPQTITVCPSNPTLNNPPNSIVTVTVNTNIMIDVTVNNGKFSSRGVSRANYPVYEWNLSGMSPGTYTVTAAPAAAAPRQAGASMQSATQRVTVKGCTITESTPPLSAALVNDALSTTDNLLNQAAAMESLKKNLLGQGVLKSSEESALANGLALVRSRLNTLNSNLNKLKANPSDRSRVNLPAQVNDVYSALRMLEVFVAKVSNSNARNQLTAPVRLMQSNSSRLNQLRQPLGASPRDE